MALQLSVIKGGKDCTVTVVMRDRDEGWGRLGVNLNQGIELLRILPSTAKIGRIDQADETGTGFELVDRIDRLVGGLVVMGGSHGAEVSPRAETHDAHAGRIDFPAGSLRADDADGALQVLQRPGVRLFAIASRHAVLKDDGLHAQRVQPGRDLGTFLVPGQLTVTTTGANDNAGTGGVRGRSRKMKELWSINVGNPNDPVGTTLKRTASLLVGPQNYVDPGQN
jgi:hypothetical protein